MLSRFIKPGKTFGNETRRHHSILKLFFTPFMRQYEIYHWQTPLELYAPSIPFTEKTHNIAVMLFNFKDVTGTIRSIAKFLDKNLSDEVVMKIAKHCSFQEMMKNPKDSLVRDKPGSASFLRKGRVGDWKNHLSDEMAALLKEEVLSKLEGSGLSFDLDGWARPSRVIIIVSLLDLSSMFTKVHVVPW